MVLIRAQLLQFILLLSIQTAYIFIQIRLKALDKETLTLEKLDHLLSLAIMYIQVSLYLSITHTEKGKEFLSTCKGILGWLYIILIWLRIIFPLGSRVTIFVSGSLRRSMERKVRLDRKKLYEETKEETQFSLMKEEATQ